MLMRCKNDDNIIIGEAEFHGREDICLLQLSLEDVALVVQLQMRSGDLAHSLWQFGSTRYVCFIAGLRFTLCKTSNIGFTLPCVEIAHHSGSDLEFGYPKSFSEERCDATARALSLG
jgi:hypothetical protein